MCENLSTRASSGTPYCRAIEIAVREGVHQPADRGAFLGHGDEDLAGLAVLVQADRDVALVAGDRELVGDRRAARRAACARRRAASAPTRRQPPPPARAFASSLRGRERLAALGAVAVDGEGLEAQPPALDVGLRRSSSGVASFGMLTVLRDGPGEERLHGGHHLDVAHARGSSACRSRGGKAQSKTGRCSVLEVGRPFDRVVLVDVARRSSSTWRRRSRAACRRRGTVWLTILSIAAAGQLLVLDQRDVRLDAGGVAVHHEADRAGRRQHRRLGVAEAVLRAGAKASSHTSRAASQQILRARALGSILSSALAVHLHHAQHRLAVLLVAGERARPPRQLARWRVGLPVHQGGDRGRKGRGPRRES